MKTLTDNVKTDLHEFIDQYLPEFKKDAKEYNGLDITFATNDDGDTWNYQTGDNSYTGGCYSLPHWAIATIDSDTTVLDLTTDIIDQLEELLPENR